MDGRELRETRERFDAGVWFLLRLLHRNERS